MKIMLVCGSLEPGKDGVGDYTYLLATSLAKYGHQLVIIALNDKYIKTDQVEIDAQYGERLKKVRVGYHHRYPKKFGLLQQHIDQFKPDWLSLQYVPYSFNKRGITLLFSWHFKKVASRQKTHIMFHEIWQGESAESTPRDKVIGYIQKKASLLLLKRSKAALVSTTNEYYRKCFLKNKVSVTLIPVFSNMPVGNESNKDIMEELPSDIRLHRKNYILGVFFGGLHYHDTLSEKLLRLSDMVRGKLQKELVITHVGRSGGVKECFDHIRLSTGIPTVVLGEWPKESIASYLSQVDIGLSNYPKILYEKSGSIAATLYNGRPVVLLKKSFEQDDRKLAEIKELEEIDDIGSFLAQEGVFFEKYGVDHACSLYAQLFNT